jgi:hypothetical protein
MSQEKHPFVVEMIAGALFVITNNSPSIYMLAGNSVIFFMMIPLYNV